MNPRQLRVLRIASGVAVLLTTAAYAHMVQHFCTRHGWAAHDASFFAALALAAVVGILSFVGGILLFLRGP